MSGLTAEWALVEMGGMGPLFRSAPGGQGIPHISARHDLQPCEWKEARHEKGRTASYFGQRFGIKKQLPRVRRRGLNNKAERQLAAGTHSFCSDCHIRCSSSRPQTVSGNQWGVFGLSWSNRNIPTVSGPIDLLLCQDSIPAISSYYGPKTYIHVSVRHHNVKRDYKEMSLSVDWIILRLKPAL